MVNIQRVIFRSSVSTIVRESPTHYWF